MIFPLLSIGAFVCIQDTTAQTAPPFTLYLNECGTRDDGRDMAEGFVVFK
ncbi:exported hypothetical protein [Halomonas sp. A3H3]|nr:exported hypothetical protein [Halomonas sp. A3H3]